MTNEIRSAVIRSVGLLIVKIAAFMLTGSAVLLAAMIDSFADVIASLIVYVIKPTEHHEEHQLALIQNFWIIAGGAIILIESIREFHAPVELATTGIAILLLTLVVDFTIVRQLSKNKSPIVVGLAEDIKADILNTTGGLFALTFIAMGFPEHLDKLVAILISLSLMYKGIILAHENMVEGSLDHAKSHKFGEGGVLSPLDYAR